MRLAVPLVLVVVTSPVLAQPGHATVCGIKELKTRGACELWALYAGGVPAALPCGQLDGAVLCSPDRLGKLRVLGSNLAWRGKCVASDGYALNRWLGGINWIGAHAVVAPSWHDGQPALTIDYAPGTPIFANTHDELREIAPGLYLGLIYDRCPCPRFRGFFALETSCHAH